LRTERSRLLLD
jgi:hypothetical protein